MRAEATLAGREDTPARMAGKKSVQSRLRELLEPPLDPLEELPLDPLEELPFDPVEEVLFDPPEDPPLSSSHSVKRP